jgi:hypothetical protein
MIKINGKNTKKQKIDKNIQKYTKKNVYIQFKKNKISINNIMIYCIVFENQKFNVFVVPFNYYIDFYGGMGEINFIEYLQNLEDFTEIRIDFNIEFDKMLELMAKFTNKHKYTVYHKRPNSNSEYKLINL